MKSPRDSSSFTKGIEVWYIYRVTWRFFIHKHQLTFSHRVAHDKVSAGGKGVHGAGVHHHLVGLLLAVHGVAGRHRLVMFVSSTRLVRKIKAVASFRRRRAHMSLVRLLLFDTHTCQMKILGFPTRVWHLSPLNSAAMSCMPIFPS